MNDKLGVISVSVDQARETVRLTVGDRTSKLVVRHLTPDAAQRLSNALRDAVDELDRKS